MSTRAKTVKGRKRWAFDVFTGYDSNGKRERVQKGGFNTRDEAQKAMNEVIQRRNEGTFVSPSQQTFGAFLEEEWLPAIRSTIRPSTYSSYSMLVSKHVSPALGKEKLQALTPGKLNALYSFLLSNGRSDGRGGLSAKTVRNIHVVIRKSLGDAVRWGRVARNVATFADAPRLRQAGDKEMRTWNATELRTFLESISEDRLYAAWFLGAMTGMRRGEILGVRWQDIDLDSGSLSIRQTLITTDYKLTFSSPKTKRSRRQIALDRQTLSVLRAHHKRQLEERMMVGAGYEDSGLAFTVPTGGAVHPDAFSQAFERHVRRAGLPRIRLHDLRHTYATLALAAGIPVKIVSERLGHASIAITLDVYSHVLPGMDEDASQRVADLIFGDGR